MNWFTTWSAISLFDSLSLLSSHLCWLSSPWTLADRTISTRASCTLWIHLHHLRTTHFSIEAAISPATVFLALHFYSFYQTYLNKERSCENTKGCLNSLGKSLEILLYFGSAISVSFHNLTILCQFLPQINKKFRYV